MPTYEELQHELNEQLIDLNAPTAVRGLSDDLGNQGKYCTLTVECMPTCK